MEQMKSPSDLEKLRQEILAKKDPKKPGGYGLCPMCNEPVEVIKVGV